MNEAKLKVQSGQQQMRADLSACSDESSYNLRLVSMEDSQIDPYLLSSPYVVNWNLMNRAKLPATNAEINSLLDKANLSEVEVKRGGDMESSLDEIKAGSLTDTSSASSDRVQQFKIESGDDNADADDASMSLKEQKNVSVIMMPKLGRVETSETFVVEAQLTKVSLDPVMPEQHKADTFLAVPTFKRNPRKLDSFASANATSSSSSSSFSVSSASFSICSNSNDKTLVSNTDEEDKKTSKEHESSNVSSEQDAERLRRAEREKREKRANLKKYMEINRQQHEVRLKALEELARLERLQAQKLREIINSSNYSNLTVNNTTNLFDSFFMGDVAEKPRAGLTKLTKASSVDNPLAMHKTQSADSFYSSTSASLSTTSTSSNSSRRHEPVGRDVFRESFMNELIVKNLVIKQQKAKLKSKSTKENVAPDEFKENRRESGSRRVKAWDSLEETDRKNDSANKTRVEVFNPRNTTVIEPPKSVRIIRETDSNAEKKRPKEAAKNTAAVVQIPSNIKEAKNCCFEIGIKDQSSSTEFKEPQLLYSAAAKLPEKIRASSTSSTSSSSLIHSSSSSSFLSSASELQIHDDSAGRQGISMYNQSGNQSLRLQQNNDDWLDSLHEFEPKQQHQSVKSSNSDRPRAPASVKGKDNVDWASSTTAYPKQQQQPSTKTTRKTAESRAPPKMSLQEAFEARKALFIRRSQQRQEEIHARSNERRAATQLSQELQIEMLRRESERKMRESVVRSMENERLCPRKRQMSIAEIHATTRKNYERLPEVKQRLVQQRLEEERLQNRLKYSIYAKTIQQRVLSNGPNFRLDFKALGD